MNKISKLDYITLAVHKVCEEGIRIGTDGNGYKCRFRLPSGEKAVERIGDNSFPYRKLYTGAILCVKLAAAREWDRLYGYIDAHELMLGIGGDD